MLQINDPYTHSPVDIKLQNPLLPGLLSGKSNKYSLPNLQPIFQKIKKQQYTPHQAYKVFDQILHPNPEIPFINQRNNPHIPLKQPDKRLNIFAELSQLCLRLMTKIATYVKLFFRSLQNKKEAKPVDREAAWNPIFPSPEGQERLIPEHKENDLYAIPPSPDENLPEEEKTFIPPKEELISVAEFLKLAQEMTNLQQRLSKLFAKPVAYKEFRNKVLKKIFWNRKLRKNEFFFNNYDAQSSMSIEKFRKKFPYFLNLGDQNERDLLAGFATYDAIADLYVQRFVQQFIKKFPQMNEKSCLPFIPSLQLVALCIAIKISWDEAIWNKDFEPYLPKTIRLEELDSMELEFLILINWNTSTRELIHKQPEELFA